MTAIPAARAAAGSGSVTALPSTSKVPASGWYTPASIFTSVDLPAPFSPTRAWASPGYSSIDPSTSACTAPNALAACRSTRIGAAPPESGGSAVPGDWACGSAAPGDWACGSAAPGDWACGSAAPGDWACGSAAPGDWACTPAFSPYRPPGDWARRSASSPDRPFGPLEAAFSTRRSDRLRYRLDRLPPGSPDVTVR